MRLSRLFASGAAALAAFATALPAIGYAAQPGEISDAAATAALNAAERTAVSLDSHVCIAVLDAGGALKAFKRMQGAAPGCVESAIAKGRAAALYRAPTLGFMERVNHGEPALIALTGMVPLGGGVPAKAGEIWIGAVGVAGSLNPNEVKIAAAGAQALADAAAQ